MMKQMCKTLSLAASIWAETYCATNNPAQGVPGPFIKPVKELIEAICGEMVRWSVVEPGVNKRQREKGWV